MTVLMFQTTATLSPLPPPRPLVSPDGNGRSDVYVLDRRNGNLTLASVSVNGRSGNRGEQGS